MSIGDWIAISSVLFSPFVWVFWRYGLALKSPRSKRYKELRQRVEGQSTRGRVYRAGLSRFLSLVDRFFEQKETEKEPFVWSAMTYDRCLLLAVIYPIGAALLGWFAFGDSGELGRALGLAGEPDGWKRLVALGLVGAIVANLILFLRSETNYRYAFLIFTLAISYFQSDLFGVFFPGERMPFAFAFAVAGAFAFAGAFAVAGAVAGAVAVAVAGAFAQRRGLFGPFLAPLSILYFVAVFAVIGFVPEVGENVRAAGILLGLTLLPLINAPFDFASIGLTRTLLRRSRDCENGVLRLVYSAADLAGALVLFVLLAIAMVVAIEGVNWVAGGVVVDVAGMIADIRGEPLATRHFWLYFALFSTLLPTFIHGAIWALSWVTFSWPWRDWMLAQIRRGDGVARWDLQLALTAQMFFAVVLTFAAFAMLYFLLVSLLGLGDDLAQLLLWVNGGVRGLSGG